MSRLRFWTAAHRVGMVATAVVLPLWIASWRIDWEFRSERGPWVRVVRGGLLLGNNEAASMSNNGWRIGDARDVHGETWWFDRGQQGRDYSVHSPGWLVVFLSAALTATAWHARRRARESVRLGCCPKCQYDRAGLPKHARCPECGAAAHGVLLPTEVP